MGGWLEFTDNENVINALGHKSYSCQAHVRGHILGRKGRF